VYAGRAPCHPCLPRSREPVHQPGAVPAGVQPARPRRGGRRLLAGVRPARGPRDRRLQPRRVARPRGPVEVDLLDARV